MESYEAGTLAVDGYDVTFGTARRGISGAVTHSVPSLVAVGLSNVTLSLTRLY